MKKLYHQMINGHHKNMKTSNEIYRVVHATNVAIICLVIHNTECSTGHNTQPDVVGPFFLYVNEDRQELYFTSMLALLCPWRNLNDIKSPDETFISSYHL